MIWLICLITGIEAYALDVTPWALAGGVWRRYRLCSECEQWHEETDQEVR